MNGESSQPFSSIENLEDLLTCPIHLGVIDEPRQLQCGHAFCLSCLENYINHSSGQNTKQICCPLCRTDTELDPRGVRHLSPSYLHKQLTEYLFKKKQKARHTLAEFRELSMLNNNNIFENKLENVNELLNDLQNNNISLDDLSLESNKKNLPENVQSLLYNQELRKRQDKSRFRSKSVFISNKNEYSDHYNDLKFHSFDQNVIRKNMRKYREYTLTKNISHEIDKPILGIAWVSHPSPSESNHERISLIYIMEGSPIIYLTNIQDFKIHSFVVKFEEKPFLPFYVKCHSNKIFLSGKIEFEEMSCVVKLSLNGEQENVSKYYPGTFGGFCFDLTNNSIFVAYPSKNQVLLIDESLQKVLKTFEFGDLCPMFVALSTRTREIWVSCPNNGRIAVYDEGNQNYLHLATNQIYDSTPTHIIETHDHRLLFLDVGKSRLFWIFRWNNCLHIQLLLVMGTMDDVQINTLSSISDNMILFSDGWKTFLAKPNRSSKEEHQKNKCVFL